MQREEDANVVPSSLGGLRRCNHAMRDCALPCIRASRRFGGMKNEALHVVLGRGKIGSRVADVVLARGGRVRMVRRGSAGAAREGLQWASGDLSDLAFARSVGEGASV